MPARPRKRPTPAWNEQWNPKKHANRRITRPLFEGRFTGSDGRIFGVREPASTSISLRTRGSVMELKQLGTPWEHHRLAAELRKKPYRYRKPKK